MPFTTASWDGSAGRWPDAASYCRSCLVDNNPSGAEKTKSECHFPVKAPGSDVYNVNALRAVVGGRGAQANFSGAEAARARARRLLAEYQGSRGNSSRSEVVTASDQMIYRINNPSQLIFRDEDGEPMVEGMVVPYNEWTEVDSVFEGHFIERFAPGSLKKSIIERSNRIKGYYEHGRDRLFGSQAIMEVREMWETAEGAFFRAALIDGLPELFMNGLRRGLYGASLGARNIRSERKRWPNPSDYNPDGLDEITRHEVKAHDISLTPKPVYMNATVMLRSITDELAVEQLAKEPEKLLEILRATTEAEPLHSEPDAPDADAPESPEDPEQVEETEPEEKPDEEEPQAEPDAVEASRDTQPPSKDYLSDNEEEAWQL